MFGLRPKRDAVFRVCGASSGTAKIPSSVRFPSFDSASGELPILERSALGAESRTSASIHTPEIEYATQYIIMSCCAGLALVLILVHRLLPERIKGLDLAFAGSHYIDMGTPSTCSRPASAPPARSRSFQLSGCSSCLFSELEQVHFAVTVLGRVMPCRYSAHDASAGLYGGMTIVLRAFAASPSAPCRGREDFKWDKILARMPRAQ